MLKDFKNCINYTELCPNCENVTMVLLNYKETRIKKM